MFAKIPRVNDTLTICEFLAQTGARARYFDMGRRVAEISSDEMLAFEHAEGPYHQPFLRAAWLGILFHYPEHDPDGGPGASEQHIWFLKLPLDERGFLQQAARDGFLHQVIETASLKKQDALDDGHIDDNPLGFAPREDRMAVFHAKVAWATGQPASQFYAHAHDYFSGSVGFEQWNFVGLQGIADMVARVAEGDNLPHLVAAIPQLPATPFAALCSCLENDALDPALCTALATRTRAALAEGDAVAVAAGVRGLAHRDNHGHARDTIMTVLAQPAAGRDVEVLAAIAGRAWELLEDDALRRMFLENLAACPAGQQAFDGIMADLMFMPRLREPLLADMRRPERSEQLGRAIGAFFQSVQQPSH